MAWNVPYSSNQQAGIALLALKSKKVEFLKANIVIWDVSEKNSQYRIVIYLELFFLQSPHSVHSTGQSGTASKSQVPVSRLLPQRLWAGATPTPLTAKSLDEICKPSSPPPTPKDHMAPLGPTVLISPLNR